MSNSVTGILPVPFNRDLGCSNLAEDGGGERDRTDDLKLAKLALSQLSYAPDDYPLADKPGGPGQTRTADLTLIRRAL